MKVYVLLIIGTWIGMVLGLSFIEAPLKFQAPGITTKLGLGIGRLVFGFSNKFQLVFTVFILVSLGLNISIIGSMVKVLFSILIVIVGIQTFCLLPALDIRATEILNDRAVADSLHHIYFVILEILKISILVLLFININKVWKI